MKKVLNVITYIANGQADEYRHYSAKALTETGAARIVRKVLGCSVTIERIETYSV